MAKAAIESAPSRRGWFDIPHPAFLRTAHAQNIVVALVAFCGPGMYNALNGLGNAGGDDPRVVSTMNSCMTAFFAFSGVTGGFFFNLLGPRLMLTLAPITYALYDIGVYLWGQNPDLGGLAILFSILLGIGAGLLWTAQSCVMMSYPTENQKGAFIGIFWFIFNLGAVVGNIITFIIANHETGTSATSVTPSVYYTFCGLMILGGVIAFFGITTPHNVIRTNGKKVKFELSTNVWNEAWAILKLFANPKMLLITPISILSNWMYTYDFAFLNGTFFNTRTRSLNSLLFYLLQMVGALLLCNLFLDTKNLTRKKRAIIGFAIAALFYLVQWGYALWVFYGYEYGTDYQTGEPITHVDRGNLLCTYTGPPLSPQPAIEANQTCLAGDACFEGIYYAPPACAANATDVTGAGQLIDFTSPKWIVPGVLYAIMGLVDAMIQSYAYWLMGTMSNCPAKLARFGGYFKGVQSAGSAVAWAIDAAGVSYETQLLINVIAAVIVIPPTGWLAWKVEEHCDDDGEEVDSISGDDNDMAVGKV